MLTFRIALRITVFECWRTDQLEEFVKALTQPIVA